MSGLSVCPVLRHKRVVHGVMSLSTGTVTQERVEWESAPCGTPLFQERERSAMSCVSCLSGWGNGHNHDASRWHDDCPLCRGRKGLK
jgi:hypothetical protein